jgi:PIN domain nuclease of toxin-antitoxin system
VKLLLDTHALVWWLDDDARLGEGVRALIGDPANDVLVSVASFWELVVKARVGKFRADVGDIAANAGRDGFTLLGIELPHLAALTALPACHRDPFDHLLIAQAIAEDATFLSDDRHVPDYPVRFARCAGAAAPPRGG